VRKTAVDRIEVGVRRLLERLRGVELSIFDPSIAFYRDHYSRNVTREEALRIALDKQAHKDAWFVKSREQIDDIFGFYQDVHVYPFRQPYNKRLGGFRSYLKWVSGCQHPRILEYGCGSAVLTEQLHRLRPDGEYHVADIPSVTLEFVKWKKKTYGRAYSVLEIGKGKEGIPLQTTYDLIVCQDVLEHTPNPLEIVTAFAEHLAPGGTLIIDFLNAPGGENLLSAAAEREDVKAFLKRSLQVVKAIDEPSGNDGIYRRPA
jgi:2-polyprenyl-3-methyl-5-hydroxy-6-metoxy-1,4-benzoquinol methylase